jgi:pimeloyl-ACP methyl ester carboxylesterase
VPTVSSNGIELQVTEAGERGRPLVVLCHGWPELAYSWRHQLPALADAGFHAVAPDQRGYGDSTRPDSIEDYDIAHLTGDLIGLLDHYGEEQAVFVGHDWGSMLVWQMAQRFPERVRAVVGMSVPFLPRTPMRPTELWRQAFGDRFFYILYFQEPGVAEAELGADARATMRQLLWSASGDAPESKLGLLKAEPDTGFLTGLAPAPAELPAWLTEDDVEVFGSTFARTGFTGGINWYRNFDRNWELSAEWAARKVTMPSMFVTGEKDAVRKMAPEHFMADWCTDFRGSTIVPGAGHWVQQERPAEVNRALLDFLASL